MTKRKGIVSKLFVAVVALTLISCCFLGSTFARYTSKGNGSATTNVALWDIDFGAGEDAGSIDVTFDDKLSPAAGEYKGSSDKRTNATGKVLVATITNNGDVDASVTVEAGALTVTLLSGKDYDTSGGYTYTGSALSGKGASQTQVEGLFSIKLYQDDTNVWADGAEIKEDAIEVVAKSGASATTVYIFAEVTWTSHDDQEEVVSDAIDTWAGENVESVKYAISYSAVQVSERPAGN